MPAKPSASPATGYNKVHVKEQKDLVARAFDHCAPHRGRLSYAYGTPTEDSDLDLLVIKSNDERKKWERIVDVRRAAADSSNPAIDVVVLKGPNFRLGCQHPICWSQWKSLRKAKKIKPVYLLLTP